MFSMYITAVCHETDIKIQSLDRELEMPLLQGHPCCKIWKK